MKPITPMIRCLAFLLGILGITATASYGEEPTPKSAPSSDAIFKRIDRDSDGRISKSEYEAFAGMLPRFKDNKQAIQQAFNRFDGNQDGHIDNLEFDRISTLSRFAKGFAKPDGEKFGKLGKFFPKLMPNSKPETPEKKPAVQGISEEVARKHRFPAAPDSEGVAVIPPEWASVPKTATSAAEIDALLKAAQAEDELKPAKPCSDEIFARRVWIDLCGTLPPDTELRQFVADRSPTKRAELIDRLLASPEFAQRQAKAWREIMLSRATAQNAFLVRPREQGLESWLTDQFQKNRDWASITRDLLTAEGTMTPQETREKGNLGFLLAHLREEGPVERANDVARVFLGINIQCSQCHDAPNDVWKRDQFHQFAAFFGRTNGQALPPQLTKSGGFELRLSSRGFGDYRQPDLDDPKVTHAVEPAFFLNGKSVSSRTSDLDRRKSLADWVTDPANYYFPAAFVNRTWHDLMGQTFVSPVDNLGPLQDVTYPEVLNRLAAGFVGSNFDIRSVFRVIMNTEAYQREFQLGATPEEHLNFAGVRPAPLRGSDLWGALNRALGPINGEMRLPGATPSVGRFPPSFRSAFEQLFNFDLSKPVDEVEATVPQALMLMNNSMLNGYMKATRFTNLGRMLQQTTDNRVAVRTLYERTLGRRPTDREMNTCLDHIRAMQDRAAAFEDLQWSLINSTEFRTRR